jgi:GTP-binding protein EngB required for normal cell division
MDRQLLPWLIQRYTQVLKATKSANKHWVSNLNSLRLAEAAFLKAELIQNHPQHPLQLLILGPTQAGKSTLVNLVLDNSAAGISALAGFTVHAQGFATNCDPESLQVIEDAFSPMQRVAAKDVNPTSLDQFVLEEVLVGERALIDKGVVWDSPDFDSIEALGYRHAVLHSAAMSDVIILAVSKDKYADKSVWDMMALLAPLAKPMLVCINKLDQQNEQTVVGSFQDRHVQQTGEQAPEIVVIPFISQIEDTASQLPIPDTTLNKLSTSVKDLTTQLDRSQFVAGAEKLLEKHWQSWVKPIEQETLARKEWDAAISEALDNAAAFYQKTYLDDPSKNDTFNRALAELLTLLEIPGLASTLSKTRDAVTWPARKLLGFGKKKLGNSKEYNAIDFEKEVLMQARLQLQNELQSHALLQQQEQPENAVFWSAASQALNANKPALETEYEHAIDSYQQEFAPRIDDAAKQLYSQLEQQPALLNSLRAARATAEAASVVLAVKSGGLAPADLIVAPAMLSVTTLLTESVLGKYMDKVKKELRLEQQKMVRSQLFDTIAANHLKDASSELNDERLWGVSALKAVTSV